MMASGKFNDKKILLLDKEEKIKNDRTWCFWETEPGLFENIVYKQWERLWFHDKTFSRGMDISPYKYKMIRGIDFYNYCYSAIRKQENIDIRFDEVKQIKSDNTKATLHLSQGSIESAYVFNSVLFEKPSLRKNEHYLLQHFKGWIIETNKPVFNPKEATFMDFRIGQQQGITFVYVLPFTKSKALVEYTLFSKELLPSDAYNQALKEYIQLVLQISGYTILEEEFGIIPMTNYRFASFEGRVINIGTAGGQTKASSGYTFKFIQKHSKAIVDQLIEKGNPFAETHSKKFQFYDSILLHILSHNRLKALEIFSPLFRRNRPQSLLQFMDNESSLKQDLKIISSLPVIPFIKAALKQL